MQAAVATDQVALPFNTFASSTITDLYKFMVYGPINTTI